MDALLTKGMVIGSGSWALEEAIASTIRSAARRVGDSESMSSPMVGPRQCSPPALTVVSSGKSRARGELMRNSRMPGEQNVHLSQCHPQYIRNTSEQSAKGKTGKRARRREETMANLPATLYRSAEQHRWSGTCVVGGRIFEIGRAHV